ncbi:MAG: AraC family transcriptional regulator [Clostridiaceae bacterium]|jgi:AraC family transcriptional regulator|nr:AraC family transcriptional regulator [Clostridiaceae bacterium]
MEWITRLNNAINYIEEHLCDTVDYDEIAKLACCSTYHFQRMFAYMADTTLSEYIRRRRMSKAAVDLQSDSEKIIDIALRYGYDSPTAFNRAFKSIHGVAPSQIKKDGVLIKTFPPISFNITIKGAEQMEYRIENKEAFRIIGVCEPLHREIEKNFEVVPQMWQNAVTDGTIQRLADMINGEPMGMLGICICNEENWRYFIAVASSHGIDSTLQEYIVPAATWAIFSGSGSAQSIQELEKRIMTEWLPTSGYEYGNAPDVEVYLNPDPKNTKYEVWIPVEKK